MSRRRAGAVAAQGSRPGGAVAHDVDPSHAACPQDLRERLGGGDDRGRVALRERHRAVDLRRHGAAPAAAARPRAGEHPAGLDEVGPGVPHLHDQRCAQRAGEDDAGADGGDARHRGKDDVRTAAAPGQVQRPACCGVRGGDRLIGRAREQPGAVLPEPQAVDGLAVVADRDRAGRLLGSEGGRRPGGVVRRGGQHGHAVPGRDEAGDESAPAPLRGADLGRVVVGDQEDLHGRRADLATSVCAVPAVCARRPADGGVGGGGVGRSTVGHLRVSRAPAPAPWRRSP